MVVVNEKKSKIITHAYARVVATVGGGGGVKIEERKNVEELFDTFVSYINGLYMFMCTCHDDGDGGG